MQSESLVEEFSRLVREYKQDDGPGGIEAWNLIADFAVDNSEAIEAALSAAEPDELYNADALMNDGGDNRQTAAEEVLTYLLIEVVGAPDDVPYSANRAGVLIEERLKQAQSAPVVADQAKLLAQVASIICEETCGLTSQCKSREAAKALYENGYLSALSAQVQDVAGLLDETWNAAVEQAAAIANDCVHLTPDPGAAIRTMLNGRTGPLPAAPAKQEG